MYWYSASRADHRGIVVHGGQGAFGGLLIDVVEDQRLAGVVVVDGGLVQPDHVGDVVHPGAVVAAGGEQLGRDGQQLLAAGQPVLGWHVYSLSAGPIRQAGTGPVSIN